MQLNLLTLLDARSPSLAYFRLTFIVIFLLAAVPFFCLSLLQRTFVTSPYFSRNISLASRFAPNTAA